MDKFDRNLDALDYQIAFFTTFGLNGAEIAKQLGKNKSTINRRLHNNLLIAEINFRRNQLFDTYAAKYATFTHLALDRGIEKLRNGEDISFKEQISLFQNADCIVGLHGAGFANLVFCEPNTKVVEFQSDTAGDMFKNLSLKNNLKYENISIKPKTILQNNQLGDIEIPVKTLEKMFA